jgi:hypothetical protein
MIAGLPLGAAAVESSSLSELRRWPECNRQGKSDRETPDRERKRSSFRAICGDSEGSRDPTAKTEPDNEVSRLTKDTGRPLDWNLSTRDATTKDDGRLQQHPIITSRP